jgi:hypothetical protein
MWDMGSSSSKPLVRWDEAELGKAITGLGAAFEQYGALPAQNGLDGKTLITLGEGDLDALIPNQLHRKRLLAELAKLGSPEFTQGCSHEFTQEINRGEGG